MWRSRSPEPPRRARAFTLLELMLVLFILAVMAAGLAIPVAAQLQLRRVEEARRQLEEAKEALLGFAAAHGRLPCPATDASRGEEAFAAGGGSADGACASFHGGLLPAATLGLAPLDDEGFARDPWGSRHNRVRYAVHAGEVNGVARALTRTDGMRQATLAGLGAAAHYLHVCSSGERADGAGCGPAAHQLTRRAAFVLLSAGNNAASPAPPASDEARNLDGDAVFVAREATIAAGREFDDVVHWVTIHLLVHRMVSAGRLP